MYVTLFAPHSLFHSLSLSLAFVCVSLLRSLTLADIFVVANKFDFIVAIDLRAKKKNCSSFARFFLCITLVSHFCATDLVLLRFKICRVSVVVELFVNMPIKKHVQNSLTKKNKKRPKNWFVMW